MIVTSIPHTGTHFLMDLLGFRKPWREFTHGWQSSNAGHRFDHILPQQKHLFLPLIEKEMTFIPLRHPRAVLKSWEDRGKPVTVLEAMWRVLVEDIHPLNPIYIPVDTTAREGSLEDARERSGLDLETNWKASGEKCGNSGTDWTNLPEWHLEAELGPILDRFYSASESMPVLAETSLKGAAPRGGVRSVAKSATGKSSR